ATTASTEPTSDSGAGATTSTTSSETTTSATNTTAASTKSTTSTSTTGTSTENGTATTPPAAPGCSSGQPTGIAAEDTFLKQWVPKILAAPAYKDDGVLIVAFAGAQGDAGGPLRTGALVVSHDTKKGKVITTAYSPYSLLHS